MTSFWVRWRHNLIKSRGTESRGKLSIQEVLRYPVLGRELPEIIREDPVTLEEFNTLLGQKLDKGIGQNANFVSSNSVYSVINRQAA